MSPVYGKWPGVVASYDDAARMLRVRVDGVTDGSNLLPLAEIEYPIGDRADAPNPKDHTELRILVGDMVWVEFMGGDPRFPIITGHRLKRAGNPTGWRRWRHANIEMTADGDMVLNATNLILNISGDMTEHIGGDRTTDIAGKEQTDVTGQQISTAGTSQHTSATHMLVANTTISGSINTIAGPGGAVGMTMRGPVRMEGSTYEVVNMTVTYTGSTITSNGIRIDHDHVHDENDGGGPTEPPH